MGFFSDLKSDLSHAVNEFKPETSAPTADEEKLLKEEEAEIEAMALDMVLNEKSADNVDPDEIANLLNMIDNETAEADASAQNPVQYQEFDNYVMPSYGGETVPVEAPAASNIPTEEAVPVQEIPAPVYNEPVEQPAAPRRVASDEVSVIMDSMIINGNMATEGSLDIRGSIVGNVEALGKLNITGSIQGNSTASEVFAESAKITGDVKSQGAIKVGQSTTIIGNVYATSAVIAGAIKGDIDVKGPVILDSTAIVLGNIKSKAVQINNGAVIEGMCSQCYAEVNPTSFFEELKKMR